MKSTSQISINRCKKLVHGSINTKFIVCLVFKKRNSTNRRSIYIFVYKEEKKLIN